MTAIRARVFSLQPQWNAAFDDGPGPAVSPHEDRAFEDGEHKLRPLVPVRDQDVYLLAPLHGDDERSVNDRLVHTLFFLGALRDAGAARLTAVVPYLCYARKDRRTKPRDPLSSRYLASLFEAIGVDRIVTVDAHNPAAYENAFRIRSEHLSAIPLLVEHLLPRLDDTPIAVVSPDTGGIKRAEAFRAALERRIGNPVSGGFMEKFRSGGVVSGERLAADVRGRVVILVDDLVSSGGTLVRAANACADHGASRVLAVATHGLLSADAMATLDASPLVALVVTDTVPVPRPHAAPPHAAPPNAAAAGQAVWEGIEVVSISPFLAEVVHRLIHGGSLVELAET